MSWRERFPYATVPWIAAYAAGAIAMAGVVLVWGWVGAAVVVAAGGLMVAGVVWKITDEASR